LLKVEAFKLAAIFVINSVVVKAKIQRPRTKPRPGPTRPSSGNIKGASVKVKGKVYRTCIQSVLGYICGTWAMKVEDLA